MLPQPHPHRRRRPHGKSKQRSADGTTITGNNGTATQRKDSGGGTSTPTAAMSPIIHGPVTPMKIDISLNDDQERYLIKSNANFNSHNHHQFHNHPKRRPSFSKPNRRTPAANAAAASKKRMMQNTIDNLQSCCENTGLNFIVPALSVWLIILTIFWWPELKDNALDYYYLQYPEQQPLSPIPGTVLPLIPNVWFYDPDEKHKETDAMNDNDNNKNNNKQNLEEKRRKQDVQLHLKEHRQPHYYMLPQDYYDQQAPFAEYANNTGNLLDDDTADSNTALEAPKIKGILIVLHNCHQSGLHFFQLPESRLVAAHALQRGLAIFSPTASTASALLTSPGGANNNNKKGKDDKKQTRNSASANNKNDKNNNNNKSPDKNCWSTSLDGDELLGPLLYEWAREMDILSLPRLAIGVANGANLLISSSLYKTLRLSSMALYASHHKDGFDAADLDRDVIPATAFIVYPQNTKATEYAMKNYNTLLQQQRSAALQNNNQGGEEEENEEDQEEEDQEDEEDEDESEDSSVANLKAKTFSKTKLWKVNPHPWTASLCQERLPEYHTRCRSFFRHIVKFQKSKQRKQEAKLLKLDASQRIKRLRLAAAGAAASKVSGSSTGGGSSSSSNAKQKYQLIDAGTGEVLQSSKSTQWVPVMEALGLDDWTTHTMAFTLATSYYKNKNEKNKKGDKKDEKKRQQEVKKRNRKKKSQLMQFPTMATAEGRSWLWASMLQEIEVAYGVQEMTSEYARQILDFLMYHAGLSIKL